MKKSDIVISVFFLKSDKPPSERELRKQLSAALNSFSIKLSEWDKTVDPSTATEIITKIGSTKRELSMEVVVKDIDKLLKGIS